MDLFLGIGNWFEHFFSNIEQSITILFDPNSWINLYKSFAEQFYNNLILEDRWLSLLKGLGVTLEITCFAIIVGTIIGIIMCFMKISKYKLLQIISNTYITVIRGTPTVVQLLIIYFGIFATVRLDKVIIATICFGINSGAYMAEIFRAGILSVGKGQMEAGRSLGFSHWKTMVYIILPQAVKNLIPTYASEFIILVKETAIVGYVALNDLTKVGDTIRSRTYSAWFPLLTVALCYLIITTLLAKIFEAIERRLRQSDYR